MGLIRDVHQTDVDQIADIYNYYILNSIFTFEKEIISGSEISKRINSNPQLPYLVYEENGIQAYAYAGPWKNRAAYKNSAEVSIYLRHDYLGKGIGQQMYMELLKRLKAQGKHAIMAGIALPNDRSVEFHRKFGFTKVAHFEEVGFKFEKWVDVAYYQLFLKDFN